MVADAERSDLQWDDDERMRTSTATTNKRMNPPTRAPTPTMRTMTTRSAPPRAAATTGVGSTIGAGVYVLVGTIAREHAGPALAVSFLIAGIDAALSAFCYAELASHCPSAGSAYHYSYICIGEG